MDGNALWRSLWGGGSEPPTPPAPPSLRITGKSDYLCEPFNPTLLKVEVEISEDIWVELDPVWYYLIYNNAIMQTSGNAAFTLTPGDKEITVIDILGRKGTITITSTGHLEPDWFEATCLLAGQAEKFCGNSSVNCTHKWERDEQPALTHDLSGWVITQQATCTATGLEKRNCNHTNANTGAPCSEGGYIKEQIIPKLPHTIGNLTASEVNSVDDLPSLIITKYCSVCNDVAETTTAGNHLADFITGYQGEIVPIIIAGDVGFTKPGFQLSLIQIITDAARKVTLDFSKCTSTTTVVSSSHPYSSTARTYITSIVMPTGWTIGYTFYADAFKGETGQNGLAEITIPGNNITSIGNGAFSDNPNLKKVTINKAVPPTLGTGVFAGTHPDLRIYVPADSVDAYKTATNWSAYAGIIEAITP